MRHFRREGQVQNRNNCDESVIGFSSTVKRQCQLKTGPTVRSGRDGDPAVVENDDLLHEREAEAGAIPLGREERLEHALAKSRRNTRAVVRDADSRHVSRRNRAPTGSTIPGRPGIDAGLERVAQKIAEGLTQQHLVALDDAEFAGDFDIAAERSGVGKNFGCGTLADGAELDVGERQLRRAREVEEVGHDAATATRSRRECL